MRVEIQHILGLDNEGYAKYLKDCEEKGIVPLKLLRDLTREEYDTYCEQYESRTYRLPPIQLSFHGSDSNEKFTQHIEKYMIKSGNPISLLSRSLTEKESKMYGRTRTAVINHHQKLKIQQQYTQQQVQYVPSPVMSNSGSNWLGQSIGESAAGFDF